MRLNGFHNGINNSRHSFSLTRHNISAFYSINNYQGSGAALRIFGKFEEYAKRNGLKELTCQASVMAKPLAEKYGFEVIEKQKKMVRGVAFIIFKMRKRMI